MTSVICDRVSARFKKMTPAIEIPHSDQGETNQQGLLETCVAPIIETTLGV
jgi:hypothetical protein